MAKSTIFLDSYTREDTRIGDSFLDVNFLTVVLLSDASYGPIVLFSYESVGSVFLEFFLIGNKIFDDMKKSSKIPLASNTQESQVKNT